MKKMQCAMIAVLLLCAMTGCGSPPAQPRLPEDTPGQIAGSPEDTALRECKLGDPFLEPTVLSSGELVHTFTDARLITSIDGIADPECFFPEVYLCLNENKEWVTGELPGFVQEDGSFSGAYVVLIDVSTTSKHAVQFTTNDLDPAGYPLGEYDDPYLFRVDTLGTLVALDHPENNELNYWGLGYIEYNSLYNYAPDLPDNHVSYHLEPGETIEYTIGFVLYEDQFAAWDCQIDVSQLYFNIGGQATTGKLIDLDLEDE